MAASATVTTRSAFEPQDDVTISRELLAELDEAPTSREHWKTLFISGMGFFTDAYDLFVIEWSPAMWSLHDSVSGHSQGLAASRRSCASGESMKTSWVRRPVAAPRSKGDRCW
jgi:hypothetical protein